MVEVRRRKSRWGTGDPAKGKEVPDNQKHARSPGEEESQWEENGAGKREFQKLAVALSMKCALLPGTPWTPGFLTAEKGGFSSVQIHLTLGDRDHLYLTSPVWDLTQHGRLRCLCSCSSPVPNKDLEASELRWPETLKQGSEGTNSKTKRKQNKKNTCLMRVFFFFLSLYVYSKFMFFFTSFLWSLHLSFCVCAHSLLLLFIWCVSFFFFFFKELWICHWWATLIPGGWTALSKARARGRPMAAERASVFKAFEKKKVTAVSRGGVWVGRGLSGSRFPRSPGC